MPSSITKGNPWSKTGTWSGNGAVHLCIMPSVDHDTQHDAANLAEVSHQPTRQRECSKQQFNSIGRA